MILLTWHNRGKIVYRKKFKPNVKNHEKIEKEKKRKKLYTENWDDIRRIVYKRDGLRCVVCGKKGKLHAHHIVPVKISKDNSLSNLISACESCHKKLEAIGFAILNQGGGRVDIRRAELNIILEAKKARMQKYIELQERKNEENRIIDESSIKDNNDN